MVRRSQRRNGGVSAANIRSRSTKRQIRVRRHRHEACSSGVGFVHADGDHDPGGSRQRGNGINGSGYGDEVGNDAGEECSDGEASVAPESVNPYGSQKLLCTS